MNHGLSEKTVNKIFSVFERFPEIEKAVLYGSRAKGNFKTGSDIDLTLYGEKLSSRLLGDIAEALDDLLLPYTIDLSIFDDLNHAKLREHIERVGVVFYEKKNQNMKAGWEIRTLDNLCDILDTQRKPITKCDRIAGEYPYYGATGILDYVENYIFDEKLVLVGEDGAKWASGENTAFSVEGKCWVNNHAHVLRPDRNKINDNWLIYFLVHSDLSEFVSGLTVPKLNQGSLKAIPIPLPPLLEQKRLVTLLDEAFESIATAKANAQQNLKNARALFESHLNEVFAESWLNNELVKLADLATDITDGDHMPPPKSTSGVPFITIGNINKNTRIIDFSDTFMVSREYFDRLKINKKPKKGDVLYTVTGSFGVPVLLNENKEFCFQRHIGLVRPKSEVHSEWLYYLLMSPQIFKQANDGATGTAQKTVSLSLLRGFQVPRVPLEHQLPIIKKLNMLAKETKSLEALYSRKIAALDELKKALLHGAFSGEL